MDGIVLPKNEKIFVLIILPFNMLLANYDFKKELNPLSREDSCLDLFFFLENVAIQFSVGSLLPRYLSFNAFSSFTSHCGHKSQLLSENYDVFLPNKIPYSREY